MDPQDLFASGNIGNTDNDLTVEAARSQKRGIEHVRPVRGCNDDNSLVGLKAVHFDKQLIERLLAFIIAAAKARAAMPPDRVNFVDEDDAWRILLRLIEHVANPARAHADKHFHEIGSRYRKKRDIGLSRYRPRSQRLARARRADQQHTARNAAAEPLKFLRVAQEFDDLLQIFLGFVNS